MMSRTTAGLLLCSLLVVVGCAFARPEPAAFGGSVGPGMCTSAFGQAAALHEADLRVAALDETFDACEVGQWLAEAAGGPAVLAGADPVELLRERCSRRAFEKTVLCRSATQPGSSVLQQRSN